MCKRFFCLLSLLLTLSGVASAQFNVGANLGTVVSATNLEMQGRETSPLAGFYPELKAGYAFSEYFSANLGVGFSQRGFKEKPFGDDERKVRLRYFNIPVYATASYPVFKKATVGASAGFQFNLFNSLDAPAPYNIDFQQMHCPASFLCGAQVGYELMKELKLELQYRLVTDFAYADDNEVLGRLHTNYFMLGVSYTISPVEKGPVNLGTVVSLW